MHSNLAHTVGHIHIHKKWTDKNYIFSYEWLPFYTKRIYILRHHFVYVYARSIFFSVHLLDVLMFVFCHSVLPLPSKKTKKTFAEMNITSNKKEDKKTQNKYCFLIWLLFTKSILHARCVCVCVVWFFLLSSHYWNFSLTFTTQTHWLLFKPGKYYFRFDGIYATHR